jgi:nucleoside phosphorylase
MPDQMEPARAIILTAIEPEYQAVRAHLSDLHEDDSHQTGTVYEIGRFKAGSNYWEVLIAQIGMGNPNAASEAERAITHFGPQYALFVGVAGGSKDVALGDVVAATKTYGYESGKAKRSFMPRPEVFRSSNAMISRARQEAGKKQARSSGFGGFAKEVRVRAPEPLWRRLQRDKRSLHLIAPP